MQTQNDNGPKALEVDGVDFGTLEFNTETPSQDAQRQQEVTGTVSPPAEPTKPEEKKPSPSPEFRYREHLGGISDLAVRLEPHSGHPIVMRWTDGSHWIPLDAKGLRKHADAFASKMPGRYGKSTIESCCYIAAPALENQGKVLEDTPGRHLIATRNHLLEILPDGQVQVLPHDRRLYVPVFIDVALDEKRIQVDKDPTKSGRDLKKFYELRSVDDLEKPSLWANLITGLIGREDERRAFQEYFGLPFTRVRAQSVAVMQGAAGTGKSQVLNVLAKAIRGSVSLNLSSVGRFDLAKLVGAPFIVGDEIHGTLNTVLFKRLTGHSLFDVEVKYQDPFTYQVEGSIMLAWNNPAKMSGENSEALEQRLVVFLCDGKSHRGTDDEITGLADLIVAKELDTVFEWALHGACRVVARGGRVLSTKDLPERMKQAKRDVGRASDPVRAFVEDFEMAPATGSVVYAKDDVYELFLKWLADEGLQPRAPMAKNTLLTHVKRVLETEHGAGCLGGEVKPTVIHKGERKRWQCLRVSFGEPVAIRPILLPSAVEESSPADLSAARAKREQEQERAMIENEKLNKAHEDEAPF